MSQHRFTARTTFAYAVIAGWDRPLGQFFLTVYREADDLSTPIYCNLDDPDALPGGGLSLEQLAQRLRVLGIDPPEGLFANLVADASGNVGNRLVRYDDVVGSR